ncbi:uncharacterized protein LOC131207394 [Anopheles bellator]|uniref:uncharacterized protein LOC131207394 n=1 Tax=Anopheles bellator TaxID=139047 RepID=UPI0026488862|nr:uncharacterized protein LOC131207394 [Anopheles bellator]
MKETVLSNNEKTFVQRAILESIRVDGRKLDEFRKLRISFGSEWGLVHIALGETRVLARVTCEVVQPKATRPNEGTLFINVELGPMAAPHFDGGRQSDESVHLNRILERALKDSACVDLESLCLVAEEKVWNLRIDVNVLNHEGNVIDCCSIAALAALAHFKRPDITVDGENVILHTLEEKEPIKVTLFHYPICVSYAIFHKGTIAIADPTYLEERVAEAKMVIGVNSYGELCGLHLGGITLTSADLLLRTSVKASKRARFLVEKIKAAILKDAEDREKGVTVGFPEGIERNEITVHAEDRLQVRLKNFKLDGSKADPEDNPDIDEIISNVDHVQSEPGETNEPMEQEPVVIVKCGDNGAVLIPKTDTNHWLTEEELRGEEETKGSKRPKSLAKVAKKTRLQGKSVTTGQNSVVTDCSDEETVTLTSADL